MTGGRAYALEWRDYPDPLAGRRVRKLTASPAEDYHLSHPSFTPDGGPVILTSNRSGTSSVYLTDWN